MALLSCCRGLLLLVLAFGISAASAQSGSSVEAAGQRLLHLLDYVSVEYPQFVQSGKVIDQEEYAEQVEFAGQVEQMVQSLPANPMRDAYVHNAAQLLSLIQSKQEGARVSALARELHRGLIAAYNIPVAPKWAPDLSAAPALYSSHCASCHGVEGDGAGPQARSLTPSPSNFRDTARQSARSVYGLYNTISLGVEGTSMPAFSALDPQDRWMLAFYVSQFGATDAQRARGERAWKEGDNRLLFPKLEAVVTMTPAEAAQQGPNAEAVLAFLRADPKQVSSISPSPIEFSVATLARSLAAYHDGKADEAYQLAVTAYLEGFELVEASLDNRDRDLRNRTEAAMMAYRNAIRNGSSAAKVNTEYQAAINSLEQSRQKLSGSGATPAADFVSSLIIILREGLEAILVLAAMAAFLTRTGRRDALPWLHGGWIAALMLGGFTWLLSTKIIAISGAQRELTEGITALVAAGLLLYVGFWLHSKANAARWNQFIRAQMSTAMSGHTLWGIALVSFLAVYREVFETVLFYQALWLQSEVSGRTAILAGLAIGSVGLTVVAWLIARFSLRLPLGVFFGASSVLLAIMAVVFAGQGIAALQEAGKLTAYPINLPSIPLLGIYPNMQGIALQLALLTFIVAMYFYMRRRRGA